MSLSSPVRTERRASVLIVTIARPEVRNCVDRPTADALAAAFRGFEADDSLKVAILTGEGEHFCAGADLKAAAGDDTSLHNRLAHDGDGPMGPTRLCLSKPVIAAVSGYAVAGGLELAAWCDLRVADSSAVFGVFCRRFGVPLIDGGSVRLPRLIGASRALDMILTGRAVDAAEADSMGLINRHVAEGQALTAALALAEELAALPQQCMRGDLQSAREQWSLSADEALQNEFARGLQTIASGETRAGAQRFTDGRC